MKTLPAILLVSAAMLVTGCSDTYRYPCQDPANFEKKECQRPLCEVDGMCSEDLVGHKIFTDVEDNKTDNNGEEPVVSENAEHCKCETTGE